MKGEYTIFFSIKELTVVFKRVIETVLTLMLSFGIVYVSYVYLLRLYHLGETYAVIIEFMPYILLIVGLVLSYFFNSSKTFFIFLIMLLIQSALQLDYYSEVVFWLIYLLIPFNLLVFSFLREQGITSLWGIPRIIFILGQGLGLYIGLFIKLEQIKLKLRIEQLDYTLLGIIILIALIILIIRSKDTISMSLSGVLIALFLSLFFISGAGKELMVIFFLIAGLMLNIGIIRSSYYMAYLDELTGLPSRRALQEELMKLGERYSIAMLDIDFFKGFNDKYGHDVGDDVLKMVASVMKITIGGAKVFRYGGEEFIILFSGRNADEVRPHLEDLRKSIGQKDFIIRNKKRPKKKPESVLEYRQPGSYKPLHITVSIGIAQRDKQNKNPEEVIKAADQALYKAKKKGRNRVCI